MARLYLDMSQPLLGNQAAFPSDCLTRDSACVRIVSNSDQCMCILGDPFRSASLWLLQCFWRDHTDRYLNLPHDLLDLLQLRIVLHMVCMINCFAHSRSKWAVTFSRVTIVSSSIEGHGWRISVRLIFASVLVFEAHCISAERVISN